MLNKFIRTTIILLLFAVMLLGCTNQATQIEDGFGTPMVLIPAGEYINPLQSRSGAAEKINVDNFYLDVYEVTNQQYAKCVESGICDPPAKTVNYDKPAYNNHPVVFVTWEMAKNYCEWRQARLPTKIEWDKAAQEELELVDYYWGDESPVCQVGSRHGAGIDPRVDFNVGTEPVGSYNPNNFGIHEMTGNVWEWVEDWDTTSRGSSTQDTTVSYLRMSRWSGYGPVYERFMCGFRCAKTP